ncbi:MAG: TolC family protein [Dysgonamonadaceae bacterium]|jgi:outer membrane protein TolC|nr:TolC family protein [Dysgonamonadaceae bacterium]
MSTKLLNRIVNTLCALAFCCPATELHAQWTIDDCQAKAKANYPLIRQYDLIEKAKEYSLSNINKYYLPQFHLNAKVSYQSDVTRIPLSLPGINIPELAKDQYQVYLEAGQTLWDSGTIRAQKKRTEAASDVEKQRLQVDLYALEERVNQLFFGVLLLDAQLEQNQILLDDLERNQATVAGCLEYGIANQADLDAVKVEQLNARQIRIQLQSTRQTYLDMLSYLMGETLDAQTGCVKPEANRPLPPEEIHRPELQWFEAQNRLFESQKDELKASYLPKLSLFLQGGIGRPGLNMFSRELEPYAIGGIRLAWNFSGLYTRKNDWRKIAIQQSSVDVQSQTFLFNLNLETTREKREIQRLREQMKYDDEIIDLRRNIRRAAEAKLTNGTATTADWLREVSRENLARQQKASHEIEWLIALYRYYNQLGIKN